ncbi:4Fe-4S binding domain-containing protein [Salipiger thiooxidans]|uniref:4Fe-4S binding domain-containing protein n=1 Tax=Salipiger thiooxidans TaxID=282683 RepID=A0A1G7HP58_9RHOB|nr:FAD:protein FMN transferase [Salipiger thiooxidans]SDF02252.1 4Fe-4S binding domain-containing protein [Salipiger thiooxidans]
MAMSIVADLCTSCGDCEPVCPTAAVVPRKGLYYINAATCTECEPDHDMPQCLSVCMEPDCIIPAESGPTMREARCDDDRALIQTLTVIVGGLGIVLLYYGTGRAAQPKPDHHETLYVFGTLVELVIHCVRDSAAREATAEVGALFQTLHCDWHAWEAGDLGKLNAAIAEGGAFRTDARLADLLREGVALSCQSGGRFDPAIGALVALWGFHEDSPPEGEMPDAAAVAALTARAPRMSDLRFDGARSAR